MEINPVLLEKEPCRPALNALGDVSILQQPLLGIFYSVKCPANLILKAHDVAREFADQGQAVTSGFQLPVEKEVLTVLLRGNGSSVVCPIARQTHFINDKTSVAIR